MPFPLAHGHLSARGHDGCLQRGLEPGEIGVIGARPGVGKTACLVQVALDRLLDGRPVLHVSLEHAVAHVRQFYDELIWEACRAGGVDNADAVRLEVERHRHIHGYVGHSFTLERLTSAVEFVQATADFHPKAIVIDDFPFATAEPARVRALAATAKAIGAEVWLTAVTTADEGPSGDAGLPPGLLPFADDLAAVLQLEPAGRRIRVRVLKDRDRASHATSNLELDPATMLLVQTEPNR